jgi:hypothetical protein
VELPVLVWIVEPGDQPFALLAVGDVQEALEHCGSVRDQALLEPVDLGVAVGDLLRRQQFVHGGHDDVLVVRAVEYADDAAVGQLAANPPQEVVPSLVGGGLLERRVADPERLERADDMLDHAALS